MRGTLPLDGRSMVLTGCSGRRSWLLLEIERFLAMQTLRLTFTCIARRGEHACPPCSGVLLAMHSEFGILSTKGRPRVEDRAGRHHTGASDRGSTGIKLSGARERTRTSRAYKQETVVPDYRRRPEALILHVRQRAVLEPIGLHSRRRLLLGTSANDFGEQTMHRY